MSRPVVSVVGALIAFVIFSSSSFADLIQLKNGYTIRGKVLIETQDKLTVEAESGFFTLDRNDVRAIIRTKDKPKPEQKPKPKPADPDRRDPPTVDALNNLPVPGVGRPGNGVKPGLPANGDARRSLGSCSLMLPKGFQASPPSALPGGAQGQNLGEFKESTSGATVSVVLLAIPLGVESSTFQKLVMDKLEQMSNGNDKLAFKRTTLNGHSAIIGDLRSEENQQPIRTLSAYVFGHEKGFHMLSVSMPERSYGSQQQRYRAIIDSFRLESPKPAGVQGN